MAAAPSSTSILTPPGLRNKIASPGTTSARRLIADQHYFGLEAQVLRGGAARALARISTEPPESARIDVRTLADDFRLDQAASAALLSALLTGGLLYPDGGGRYQPTRLFREYALASVVAPLARERAKGLLGRACRLAATINSDWSHLPVQIEMIAVSGSFMTSRDHLSDLSLSLALGPRPATRAPHLGPLPRKDVATRQVVDGMRALSSFIAVRIVTDRKEVPRPFGIVFEAGANEPEHSPAAWDRLRDWSASVTRWLAVK